MAGGQEDTSGSMEPFRRVSPSQARQMMDAGNAAMVDVRNDEEHREAHVSNSALIPVDQILERYPELPSKGNLLFICRTGVRSALAAEYAAAMGASPSRLHNVDGGIERWIAEGLEGVVSAS